MYYMMCGYSSISSANAYKPTSRNTSVRLFQDTGFFPLPLIHSCNIRRFILWTLSWHWSSMLAMKVPLSSSSSFIPNSKYLHPISLHISILRYLPWNEIKFIMPGVQLLTIFLVCVLSASISRLINIVSPPLTKPSIVRLCFRVPISLWSPFHSYCSCISPNPISWLTNSFLMIYITKYTKSAHSQDHMMILN